MTRTRRSFIRLAMTAASVPFIGRFVPPAAASAAAPAAAPGFHMVNGWILTDADVAALRDYGIGRETV